MPINLGKPASNGNFSGRYSQTGGGRLKHVTSIHSGHSGQSDNSSGKRKNSTRLYDDNSLNSSDNMFLQDIAVIPCSSNNSLGSYSELKLFHGLEAITGDNISRFDQDSYRSSEASRRIKGGGSPVTQHKTKVRLSPSQCKLQAPLLSTYKSKKPTVNYVSLEMQKIQSQECFDCSYPPKVCKKVIRKEPKTRTRGTQSLYRESSAQTLPFLPPVANDPDDLETMELFKLPSILPGDAPPGLYDVEILERARKRWAFAKALKDSFRKQMQEARQQAKLPQHKHIWEAFEWEHWIEREEYIQECQMLRLDLLIEMFNKREKQMRTNSELRIQQSYLEIEKKRKRGLQKNEIEYMRAMRRLEMQHAKRPRVWRKEHITYGLGDPSSEFYAPKMRYGVDPGRRHFIGARKGFDIRMDDLEKRTVKLDPGHLICPFAKLNEWAKPKEVIQEVEQNFCSEDNLRKLYESLRALRENSEKPKTTPVCLKAKIYKSQADKNLEDSQIGGSASKSDSSQEDEEIRRLREESDTKEYMHEVQVEKTAERLKIKHIQREMRHEEFETLVHSYEGHTIGWLLRFLKEEQTRLKEQRKLHFYTMLMKRERWQREAAEAGLRQKENAMRQNYERLYQECEEANRIIAEKYVTSILESDLEDIADELAEEDVLAVAQGMDKEMAAWLESFRDVQNPDNYHSLREALTDIFMPNTEKVLYRKDRDDCISYIIDDVIMANVFNLLDSYDVTYNLASDIIDRTIGNDLYQDSTDNSSECECAADCICPEAKREAWAIIRKLIRQAVPGRSWKTPTERVCDENVNDILGDVFDMVIIPGAILDTDRPMPMVQQKFSYIDITIPQKDTYFSDEEISRDPSPVDDYFKVRQMGSLPDVQDYTKELNRAEGLLLTDPDRQSEDRQFIEGNEYTFPFPQAQPRTVHNIPSTHDLSSIWDFAKTPVYSQSLSDKGSDQDGEQDQEEEEEFCNDMEEWQLLEHSSSHLGEEENDDEMSQGGEEQVAKEQLPAKSKLQRQAKAQAQSKQKQQLQPQPQSTGKQQQQAQTEPQLQQQPQTEPQTQAQAQAQKQAQEQAQEQPQAQPQAHPQEQPQPQVQAQAQAQAQEQPQAQPQPQEQPQAQPQPQEQPQAQPQPQAQEQPQSEPIQQTEPQPETKPQPQPEPQPQSEPQQQPETQPEPKKKHKKKHQLSGEQTSHVEFIETGMDETKEFSQDDTTETAEEEEIVDTGVIPVQFGYDPSLNFSIPVPSWAEFDHGEVEEQAEATNESSQSSKRSQRSIPLSEILPELKAQQEQESKSKLQTEPQ